MDIFSAKNLYGVIYSTVFPKEEITVYWHGLSWREFKHYKELAVNQFLVPDIEEEVFRNCVLDATIDYEDIDSLNAGIITTVFHSILSVSGPRSLSEIEIPLNFYRTSLQNVEEQIPLLICSAFPYKPEDIEELEWPTVLKRLAQAEIILSNTFPSVPVQFVQNQVVAPELNIEKDIKDMQKFNQAPPEGNLSKNAFDARKAYLDKKGLG